MNAEPDLSLYRLNPGHQDSTRAVFASLDFHLAVGALLDGSAAGQVYLDHPLNPTAGLAWTGHRIYLAGEIGTPRFLAAARQLLAGHILPQYARSGAQGFVLYFPEGDWAGVVEQIVSPLTPLPGLRRYLELERLEQVSHPALPDGFALLPVSPALLVERTLKDLDLLLEEMQSERESVADFLERSFGLCLLQGETLVGWCLSEYNTGSRCEVGIAVMEGYRRRGLATLLGFAFARQAAVHGISRLGWHCWAGNQASTATALKIGFTPVRDYLALFCPLGGGA